MCIDLDRINLDVRPTDVSSINNLKNSLMEVLGTEQVMNTYLPRFSSAITLYKIVIDKILVFNFFKYLIISYK